jgi:hypothetical protein
MARLGLLVLMWLLVSCGSGPTRLEAALDSASSVGGTYRLTSSSGSAAGLRAAMRLAFPAVDDLIGGGRPAHDAMLKAFGDTPSEDSDLKLTIFAWALEQMGTSSDASVFESFVARNLTSDVDWSLHFATHAIRTFTGYDDGDLKAWYYVEEMELASGTKAADQKSSPARNTCLGSNLLVDANGVTITWYDGGKSEPVPVRIDGWVRSVSAATANTADLSRAEIEKNGGTFVYDDPEFPGIATRQFDCAGYALRELNHGKKWWVDPSEAYRVLVGAGQLVEVPESAAQPGDKVFYFAAGAILPGHVAEIHQVEQGLFGNTILVRNADGDSGLWEADVNADYYTKPSANGNRGARYPTHQILRWSGGQAPKTIPNSKNPLPCGAAANIDGGADADSGLSPDAGARSDGSMDVRDDGGNDSPVVRDSATDGSKVFDTASAVDRVVPASGFSASISIPGYAISFSPTVVMGSNQGTYDGTIHLNNVVGVFASESGTLPQVVTIMFDRQQIAGPTTCQFKSVDQVFESESACAAMTFFSPAITNADDGSPVVFEATSGVTILSQWGTALGDRLSGTFSASLTGTRVTGLDASGRPIEQSLSGTATGAFNVVIQPDS